MTWCPQLSSRRPPGLRMSAAGRRLFRQSGCHDVRAVKGVAPPYRRLPAWRGALGGSGRAFDRDHPLLEKLREDAGSVEAVQAADGVEVLEADRPVDLRQDEPGARI